MRIAIEIDVDHVEFIRDLHYEGIHLKDRTSVGSSIQWFGKSFRFYEKEDSEGFVNMPFIQWRTFAPRIAFHEWKWMMNGMTDSKWLEERKINIWKGNTSREFLDSRGLQDLPEGDIGKTYGYQFRNFGGVDQLEETFNNLRDNPFSRRHVISIWNAPELKEGALEPCAFLYTFMVSLDRDKNKVLNLHMNMRSCDFIMGWTYDMAFASFWLAAFAKALGYKTGELFQTITNVHYYSNQQPIVDYVVENYDEIFDHIDKMEIPQIRIEKDLNSLDDILNLEYSDIQMRNWKQGPKIHTDIQMAV